MLAHQQQSSTPEPITIQPPAGESSAVDLSTLWTDLVEGRWVVTGSACTPERCYLIFRPSDPQRAAMAQGPRCHLERALLGEPLKALAIDLGVSPSTITRTLRFCLHALGLPSGIQQVPLFLVMAAQATYRATRVTQAKLSPLRRGEVGLVVASTQRPDAQLGLPLSREERAVARMLVEGKSHREIATFRKRSLHTVSNQLSSVYAKLGVCGRFELVGRLLSTQPIGKP